MTKERLQEIKDSINFQYELIVSKGMNKSALLFTDEEQELVDEIERLNKTLEDIDTYIHLWKLEEIGEKTMLILNDILLIKNGMGNEVVRLNGSDKE